MYLPTCKDHSNNATPQACEKADNARVPEEVEEPDPGSVTRRERVRQTMRAKVRRRRCR
jgi:hypothetical protein